MKRAAVAAVLIAPACAAMGVNVVSFRLAFFSDAVSHSAFAGAAVGLLAGIDPRLTVAAFGILVGAAIVSARRWSDAPTDTAVGVAMAGVVALGIALISARGGLRSSMHLFLYGDLLTAGDFEIGLAAILLAVSLVFSALAYNRLLITSFDRNLAVALGVRERAYEYACALLLAVVVCFAVMAAGLLLATAMLVVPAAAGRNFARTAGGFFWWSVAASMVSSVAGLPASAAWNTPTGATIVLFSVALFGASAIYARLLK